MLPTSFDTPVGGFRVVRRCSAQLVETFGQDGKCLHQEVIIHRYPSTAPSTTTDAFFHPLSLHMLGKSPAIQQIVYPTKCSGVILNTYVATDNPGEFRIGILGLFNQERSMKATEVASKLDDIISALEDVKSDVEDNDTLEYDVGRKLNLVEELTEEISDYVSDRT